MMAAIFLWINAHVERRSAETPNLNSTTTSKKLWKKITNETQTWRNVSKTFFQSTKSNIFQIWILFEILIFVFEIYNLVAPRLENNDMINYSWIIGLKKSKEEKEGWRRTLMFSKISGKGLSNLNRFQKFVNHCN